MDQADHNLLDVHRPPVVARPVRCAHCQQEYSSANIQWQPVGDGGAGYWHCPTAGCEGRGFGFDIFPIVADASDIIWAQQLHEQGKDHDLYL